MDERPTGVCLVAPSTVAVGEPFALGVKMLRPPYAVGSACYHVSPAVVGRYNLSPRGIAYMDNVPADWAGSIALDGGDGYDGPASVSFAEGSGPCAGDRRPIRRIEGLRFTTPGTKFISARLPDGGVEGTSNSIRVTADPPAERLFWGDLHSQTFFSDGLRCPEELYAFARDEAFLDVFAMADHSESLSDRQWDYFVAVTNDFNQPGRFATLVGQEWTSRPWGHRNVYYRGDAGPVLRCTDPVDGDLTRLYQVARQHGALVIPHHSANVQMGVDWSLGHDPEVERLVEIHSVWGNSERPGERGNPFPLRTNGGEKPGQHVLDALRLGRRYGFIGGGDIHDGRPGDELHAHQTMPEQYHLLRRQGIMGVWASELTREAIFDALWNRRCFATMNARVWLRFHVNGHPMGSVIPADGELELVAEAASESPIIRIDLVSGGEDVETATPNRREIRWQLRRPRPDRPAWFYVRLTRADGLLAWSSPVWIE